MSKSKKQDLRCIDCSWELKGTNRHLDGIKCPKCKGIVINKQVIK